MVKDRVLYRACEECVADAGKEDKDLVDRLYNHMYENYDLKNKSWNYQMIDNLINKWSQQEQVSYKECITDDIISIVSFIGPVNHEKVVGSSTCSYCGEQSGSWYFNRLFVDEKYRGNGIGSKMLDKMLERVKEKDIVLQLEINPYGQMTREELEDFYTRHGFVKIPDKSVHEDYYSFWFNRKENDI